MKAEMACGCIINPYSTASHQVHDANCLKWRRVKMASQYLTDLLREDEKAFIMLIPQMDLGCKSGNQLAAESEDGLALVCHYGLLVSKRIKAARSSEHPPQSTPST